MNGNALKVYLGSSAPTSGTAHVFGAGEYEGDITLSGSGYYNVGYNPSSPFLMVLDDKVYKLIYY